MIETKIVDEIIRWNYIEKDCSKSAIENAKKIILDKIKDPKNYLKVTVTNGKVEELIFAEFSDAPFELDRIQIGVFLLPVKKQTQKVIKEELRLVRNYFHPKKLKLVMAFKPEHEKLHRMIKKLGFKTNGVRLKAFVSKSFNALKKMKKIELPEGFSIRHMNYKQDINQVLKIEKLAHRNEPSSVVHRLPAKHWGFFRGFLKGPAKVKAAFVLEYKGRTIGFAAHNQLDDLLGNTMIATISIHPKYKGKGLSKHLYLKLLEDMKNKKIKKFFGYSKTQQVLEFSRKIERYPMLYAYVMDIESLQSL